MITKTAQKKKPSLKLVKKKAWDAFSKYIRLRDCLITTGTKEEGLCFTCGVRKTLKQLQAGHFVDSRCNAVLFEEDGVHAQCLQCNYFKAGNKDAYTPKMIKMYGLARVDELQEMKNVTKSFKIDELVTLKEYYVNEFKEIFERN